MKYVVVTGGVISGLGKGISISSLGALFKASGKHITAIKIDPYLNCDAGTMSPLEHGEVFVLNDGGEADLDLGNYERFMDLNLTRDHNITTGKVYMKVLDAERRGDYLGKTVQIIPHVTNAVQAWIQRVAQLPVGPPGDETVPEVCFIELGGTVGDMESAMFLEALRQLQRRVGRSNLVFVHVSLVPVLGSGEQKSKPTQHSVRALMASGIQPDLVLCRCRDPIDEALRRKLAMFCQVDDGNMLTVADVSNIYHVPLLLHTQGAASRIGSLLGLDIDPAPGVSAWKHLATAVDTAVDEVHIALVGKYTGLQDSYLSVLKALKHSAVACNRRLVVDWVEAETLEAGRGEHGTAESKAAWALLEGADGVLVPGGFGTRGTNGKIAAVQYARTSGKPFLGVCLGMQCVVIEHARNVLGWEGANSSEFDEDAPYKMVVQMHEIDPSVMGGTMRLGATHTMLHGFPDDSGVLQPSLAHHIYGGKNVVLERHRHRYEVNPTHVPKLVEAGLRFSGVDHGGQRMECVELPRHVHPFFFAAQYHPEFLTRPMAPSPPFLAFVSMASDLGLPAAASAAAAKMDTATLVPFRLPGAAAASTPAAGAGGGAGSGALPATLAAVMRPISSPPPTPGAYAAGGGAGRGETHEATMSNASSPLTCGAVVKKFTP